VRGIEDKISTDAIDEEVEWRELETDSAAEPLNGNRI
jgi:hypothetical protein